MDRCMMISPFWIARVPHGVSAPTPRIVGQLVPTVVWSSGLPGLSPPHGIAVVSDFARQQADRRYQHVAYQRRDDFSEGSSMISPIALSRTLPLIGKFSKFFQHTRFPYSPTQPLTYGLTPKHPRTLALEPTLNFLSEVYPGRDS